MFMLFLGNLKCLSVQLQGMVPKLNTSKKQIPAVCSKVLSLHNYHVGQCVVYQDQDDTSKWWYPTTITSLSAEKGTYMIRATNGAVYKEMQAHLKSYTSQDKNCQYPSVSTCGQ